MKYPAGEIHLPTPMSPPALTEAEWQGQQEARRKESDKAWREKRRKMLATLGSPLVDPTPVVLGHPL